MLDGSGGHGVRIGLRLQGRYLVVRRDGTRARERRRAKFGIAADEGAHGRVALGTSELAQQ